MKTIYLHIGYPKTGTTLLQKKIYPKIEKIEYIGKEYSNKNILDRYKESFRIDINIINFLRKIKFNNSIPKIVLKKETSYLLSEESIIFETLRPHNGNECYLKEHYLIIEAIEKIFPKKEYDVHLIFTIRNQVELIQSIYPESYYHHYRKCKKLNTFKKFYEFICNKETKLHHSMDFYETILEYEKNFTTEKIHILLYEDLKKNPKEFILKLSNILKNNIIYNNKDFISKMHSRKTDKPFVRSSNYITLFDLLSKVKLHKIFMIFGDDFIDTLKKIKIKGAVSINVEISEAEKNKIKNAFSKNNKKLDEKYNLKMGSEYYE